jgi:hypothetical protein
LRICFDRIAPLGKGRPVPFALPPLECHEDAVEAARAIVMGMADGELTPTEAQDIFKVLEAFVRVLTSPARRGLAPADAAASRQPRAPAETSRSSGFAAAAGGENIVVLDRVSTFPATNDQAPSADVGTCRRARESAESCRSSSCGSPGSEVGVSGEKARDPVQTFSAMPDPAPSADAKPSPQRQEPEETCKPLGSDGGAGGENVAALDPTFPAMPDPAPSADAKPSPQR